MKPVSTETIAFRVTLTEKQLIAAIAAQEDRTVSQLIRRLVIKHYGTKEDQ